MYTPSLLEWINIDSKFWMCCYNAKAIRLVSKPHLEHMENLKTVPIQYFRFDIDTDILYLILLINNFYPTNTLKFTYTSFY